MGGFLDSLGKIVKGVGEAAIATPGAMYDMATYALPGDFLPGDRGYSDFGDLLNNLGSRANDLTMHVGDIPVVNKVFGKVMEGAAYESHQVDRAYSTLGMMSEQVGYKMDPTIYFDPEQWSKAWDIADKQNTMESAIAMAKAPDTSLDMGLKTVQAWDPDSLLGGLGPGKKVSVSLSPFEQTPWVQDHPFLAHTTAAIGDFAFMWFVDPLVVAGKMAGIARADLSLGRVAEADKVNIAERLDGSLTGGKAALGIGNHGVHVDVEGRYGDWLKYINGKNPTGRALNAAEIRASSKEVQKGSQSLAFSSAMEDALKIEDPADRLNASRRVAAVALGDASQIDRLKTEIAGTQELAQKLNNIVSEKTLDLQAQALNEARKDSPAFRAAFDSQVSAMDENGDLSKFIKDWHADVSARANGLEKLDIAKNSMDYVPGVHGGPMGSNHRLRLAGEANLGAKVQRAHDAVTARVTRLPSRDSYTTLWQRSLYTVPVVAVYPARFAAALLPTNLGPKLVDGLRTVHYNGVINTHDWESASDQLNSLMIHADVDNEARLRHLSDVYAARTEAERVAVKDRVEQVAVDGVAKWASKKHGFDIDSEYVQAAAVAGQQERGAGLAALWGGRASMHSATPMPPEMAMRARNIRRARTLQSMDDKRVEELARRGKTPEEYVDEQLADWTPRVDQWIDSSGSVASLALDTSQLVNRIPLIDIHALKRAVSDRAFAERLERQSHAWRDASITMDGLKAQLARATGSNIERLQKAIAQTRKTQDWLLSVGTVMNRWWKLGVLFRLGYPMRVLADDHMRIAARIGYIPFLMANVPEGIKNNYYNYLPGFLPKTRRMDARAALEYAKARRAELASHFGRDRAHTDTEWEELQGLVKAHLNGSETAAQARRREQLDPDHWVTQWEDLQAQTRSLRRAISTHTRSVTAHRESGDTAKANEAQAKLMEAQGAFDQVTEQLAGKPDPNELRKRIADMDEAIRVGPKAYRDPKRHIGEADVDLGDGVKIGGAFSVPGYHEATSSQGSFEYLTTEGEKFGYRLNASGHWRTIAPGAPGYYQLWANILNHQIKHGSGYMPIVRGEIKSPEEFAKWLAQPSQRNLRERVANYAHDPVDWGGRLMAMVDDYVPSAELAEKITNGRVSARQLKRMFPTNDPLLPNLHGQLADVQSGRAPASRVISDGIQRAFTFIAERPTDALSRHPFFNAVYKAEAKKLKERMVLARGKDGVFTQDDLREIERVARDKALKELKSTLWDISAHSHTAHVLRFLSPFFAAHQEALNRWWGIAKDDPSVARHFQMFFDDIRQTGLVYNDQTGEAVKPGAGIGNLGNKIMLKLPWADDNNAVNKWLLRMGGGKYWSINENGLNLILQNGIANPGVGPLVTIPMESLSQKYADETTFTNVWQAISPYRTPGSGHFLGPIDLGVAENAVLPAWGKRLLGLAQGPKSAEFSSLMAQNVADNLTTFHLMYGREPTPAELDKITDKASKQAHTDLVLELVSNLGFITPAKPNSKFNAVSVSPVTANTRFAAVQNGLQKLYEQMRTEGKDLDWLRATFREKYGDAYMAMIYSMGSNPAHLTGSVAEYSAIKKYSGVVKHIDPSLLRMAIGPEVSEADKADQLYSSFARAALSTRETGEPGTSFFGKKDPRLLATSLTVQRGWDQLDELTNALDVMADQQGLPGYEASPALKAAKQRGLDYIKAKNPVFAQSYDSYTQQSFDGLVSDMRKIVADKKLASDPTRSDIYWLGQYIQLRDTIQAMLKQRATAGGSKTIGAQDNADLANAFSQGVQYINSQSPYFKQYDYTGIIERDPLLVTTGVQQ